MRLEGVSAWAPDLTWSNARVAARLRLERMRLDSRRRAVGAPALSPEEAKLFQTSDRWVRRFIGFSERRFSCDGQGTSELAAQAARQLFDGLGQSASDIDGIIVASVTPTHLYSPPDASLLQHALGIPVWRGDAPRELKGADVSLACSSWVAALGLCYAQIRSGMARRILLIGADRMSATINWRDRGFATVLGDAGTATLCSSVDVADDWFEPQRFWSWLDGSHADIILTPAGGSKHPTPTREEVESGGHLLAMDGAAVRKVLVPFIGGPAMTTALAKAGLAFADLDVAILHEANLVLNESIVREWRELGFKGRVLSAGGRFGNTTSASVPLALALNADQLPVGTRLGLIGFGGGLSASFAFGTVRQALPAWTNVGAS